MIRRAGPPSVHALGLAAVSAALLVAALVIPLDAPFLFCPFRAATGLPCLGCGCTHAFHFMIRGQVAAAFASSPLGALLFCACAAHLAWTALRLCGLPWAPALEPTRRLRWTAAAALAANWAFLVLR
ncbi:MAG: DUF2752 domain-containing protein [Myxococcales bacterium]